MKKVDLHQVRSIKKRKLPTRLLRTMSGEDYRQLRTRIKEQSTVRGDPATSRHARNLLRKLDERRYPGRGSHKVLASGEILARKRESELLEAFYPPRNDAWTLFARRKTCDPIICNQFSFLDEPENTLLLLSRISEIEAKNRDVTLDFNFRYCSDIGPFLVLGMLNPSMSPCIIGGRMQPPVKKVLGAVGLSEFMGLNLLDLPRAGEVWPFRLRSRPSGKSDAVTTAFSAQAKEKVADDLTEVINQWLGASSKGLPKKKQLTALGRSTIKRLVTEVLDNAERHASIHNAGGIWHLAGFMARRALGEDPTQIDYVCHISIVNLGISISETINSSSDHGVRALIDHYCHQHGGLSRDVRQIAKLRTIVALQPGVSRFTGDSEIQHGMGFMKMMEFVHAVGERDVTGVDPRITIISGSVCIRLWKQYSIGPQDPNGRRWLWFNQENKIALAPDDEYVSVLPIHFPGTLVSLRFRLAPEDPSNERAKSD